MDFFFNFHKVQSIKHSFTEKENKASSGKHVVDRPWGALLPSQSTQGEPGEWRMEPGLREQPFRLDLHTATPVPGTASAMSSQ